MSFEITEILMILCYRKSEKKWVKVMKKVKEEDVTALMKVVDKISSFFFFGLSFLKREKGK